jgi:hypothetical protein
VTDVNVMMTHATSGAQLSAATVNGYDHMMNGYGYCNAFNPYYAQHGFGGFLTSYTDIRNPTPSLPLLHQHQHQHRQQQQHYHHHHHHQNDAVKQAAVVVAGGMHKREKQKRQRTAYSSKLLMHLEESFMANQYLNRARCIDLARTLKLTEKQIKI